MKASKASDTPNRQQPRNQPHQSPGDASSAALGRRQFIASSAALARGSLLVLTMPALLAACREAEQARTGGSPLQTLTGLEAAEFEAMAARIIPSDDTAGAREAGVIYFIDQVLGEASRTELLTELREGLAGMQQRVASEYGEPYFHLLDDARQDQLLTTIETTPLFSTIRYLTIAGMFSLPRYGGNRDGLGYQLIGMDNRGAWAPPFGFYDADYREQGA